MGPSSASSTQSVRPLESRVGRVTTVLAVTLLFSARSGGAGGGRSGLRASAPAWSGDSRPAALLNGGAFGRRCQATHDPIEVVRSSNYAARFEVRPGTAVAGVAPVNAEVLIDASTRTLGVGNSTGRRPASRRTSTLRRRVERVTQFHHTGPLGR